MLEIEQNHNPTLPMSKWGKNINIGILFLILNCLTKDHETLQILFLIFMHSFIYVNFSYN